MELREALDVRLVDDGLRPRRAEQAVALPVEAGVDDERLRDRLGVVLVVGLEVGDVGVVGDVGQRARLLPLDLALDRLAVRVDEQLAGVEAVALLGQVRAVHAVAVALARADVRQVAVPVVGRALPDLDARLVVVGVEEAELDALGVLAEEAEVRALAEPRRAERERAPGPDLDAVLLLASVALAHRTSAPESGPTVSVPSRSAASPAATTMVACPASGSSCALPAKLQAIR